MTEETVENVVSNESAQAVQENDWEEREKEAKAYIKNDPLYKQVVYISNDDDDCFPIPYHELDNDLYPYVVERPTGINHPKYNWTTRQWEENSAQGQATKLNVLTNELKEAQQEIATLKENNSNIAKENTQLTTQLDNLKEALSSNTEQSAKQAATLIQMLSMATAKIDALTTSAGTSTAVTPPSPQPTSQATTTESQAPVAPVATSDDTKKEGE
ncbi:hypothetical protein FP435_04465 [Lactobacillus sp. PV037]|uniref:hypothetical protein n=1 Tax=Lactobacillus sp. PV037 TaxID=2594496 RepID=UPI00223F3DD0|nr:hypothetical protein [Lactobacillus sp. PV037]QNQ83747.1 hypothetical protein FP435_04465 [Lactobacillus sp. PV037]